MVHCADIDVVDVEKNLAPGHCRDLSQELALRNRRFAVLEIRRRILDQDLAPEIILHFTDAAAEVSQRLLRVRKRQQVVQVASVDGAPGQVIGHEPRRDAIDQRLQLCQMDPIEWIGRAER